MPRVQRRGVRQTWEEKKKGFQKLKSGGHRGREGIASLSLLLSLGMVTVPKCWGA